MEELLQRNAELRARFSAAPAHERWSIPFPLAVFGTLRRGGRNAHLMGRDPEGNLENEGVYRRADAIHYAWRETHRGLLPHFLAIDLQLAFRQAATAPFEVYDYAPCGWEAMIEPVDRLEGFDPSGRANWIYQRTLAWIYLLPAEFEHELYKLADPISVESRDLALPARQWRELPRLACWIYSSTQENEKAKALKDNPLLWWGNI